MHVGVLQALGGLQEPQGPPGAWRLQAAPGASGAFGGLQKPHKTFSNLILTKNAPAAYRQSLEPWARPKFHAGGQAGLSHPPWGGAEVRQSFGREGSERPEAGCLGELCGEIFIPTVDTKILHDPKYLFNSGIMGLYYTMVMQDF